MSQHTVSPLLQLFTLLRLPAWLGVGQVPLTVVKDGKFQKTTYGFTHSAFLHPRKAGDAVRHNSMPPLKEIGLSAEFFKRPLSRKIIQKLRDRIYPRYPKPLARARAGHIQQMALGVVDVLKITEAPARWVQVSEKLLASLHQVG